MSGIYIPGIIPPKDEPGAFKSIIMYVGADGKIRAECDGTHEVTIVPDHGRLIDGDELAAGCDDTYWCRWLSEIEDAPTIIPEDDSPEEQKPLTNADRIRAMTDEELADNFASRCCPHKDEFYNCEGINRKEFSWEDCKSCWLDWLKQEVDT